jgi:LPXTG-site transpeptidase (sortase) family protein
MGTTEPVRGSELLARRWIRRAPLLVLSLVFAAAGIALATLFGVGAFSASDSGTDTGTVRHFTVQPESIYDRPVTFRTPAPTPSPTPEPTPALPAIADRPFTLVIPNIGVEAPVNAYGLDASLTPEVPLNGYEVAWYNWSSEPGTGSNAVFAGHVTWGGAAVFYNLEDLRDGDEIILRGEDGAELQYTVEDNFLVDPADKDALSVMGPTEDDTITVITCGGDWYYDANARFGAEYTNRRVVRAGLSGATQAPENAVSAGSES